MRKHTTCCPCFELASNKSLLPFFKKHTTFSQKAYYLFPKSLLPFLKELGGGIGAVIKSVQNSPLFRVGLN